jgi:hypothetical protein
VRRRAGNPRHFITCAYFLDLIDAYAVVKILSGLSVSDAEDNYLCAKALLAGG